MDKNEELQKWLNDDRYVQIEDLATLWNLSVSSIRGRIRKRKIKSTKRISLGQNGHHAFYDKHDCEMLLSAMEQKKQEIEDWSRDTRLLDLSNIARAWNMSNKAACAFLGRKGIKPIKKANLGKCKGCCAYYDRAECERARPFINQPEQKEVEQVEEVNLLESELDSEELASENGSAINDAELAAIITACKDPVDKIMILSALCFGVKSGELSSLNLRDISGADICLQSPSGVVKMRIPKQYEDARTELLTYYVNNGNNLSGDMPVFLNRSGIRMTRQGLNNRMKSVSESANIDRDVKLSDLRATFAQNIYKKTEKNIASVHKYLRLSENTNIMGYLLETQSKEQKTMPVDLMNSLTASYQAKEPPTIAEPKEQTPDIIPADTIDLFTMSELESELKNRGVELTTEVIAKINDSDMPEMKHIAKMLRGNAKTITIGLSVLNEIAGQLREVKPIKKVDLTKVNYFLRLQREQPKHFRLRRLINRIVKYKKFVLEHEIHDICWNLAIKIADDRSAAHKIFHAALGYEQAFFWFTKGNYASGIGTFCLKDKKDLQKIVELNQDKVILTEEDRAFWYKRNFGADENVFESNKSNLHSGSTWIKNMMGLVITDKIVQMAQKDGVSIPEKLRSIINAAWIMGNYEKK